MNETQERKEGHRNLIKSRRDWAIGTFTAGHGAEAMVLALEEELMKALRESEALLGSCDKKARSRLEGRVQTLRKRLFALEAGRRASSGEEESGMLSKLIGSQGLGLQA